MIYTGEEVQTAYRKLSVWGTPKMSGKSTFVSTMPGLVFINHYDIGTPTIAPGKDPKMVKYKTYPVADATIELKNDKWKRAINIGEEILHDLVEWRAAYTEQRPARIDGVEIWPLPESFVLDGWVNMGDNILNWMLGINNLRDPSDSDDARTKVWGRRLANFNTIFNMVLPLPANIAIVTWQTPVTRQERDHKGNPIQVDTGKITADYGGKLDMYGNGKVDASLYLYSRKTPDGTRFYARIKSTDLIVGVGVRGLYTDPRTEEIDITIDPTAKTPQPLPWDRIFGKSTSPNPTMKKVA